MANVTVFVDRAVLGEFPPVCALTGSSDVIEWEITQQVTTFSSRAISVLLLLAGPLGWVCLALLCFARRDELKVRLPLARRSAERIRSLRATRVVALAVAVGSTFGAILLELSVAGQFYWIGEAAFAVALLGLFVAAIFYVAENMQTIGVQIDASRRWVTLRHVHPDFAAACEALRFRSDDSGARL